MILKTNTMTAAFHIALPAKDLEKTRQFYQDILLAKIGREGNNWIDINFYGNQITFNESRKLNDIIDTFQWYENDYPIAHIGAILEWNEWHKITKQLKQDGVEFLIDPHLMFAGEAGEQKSVFLKDPNGYPIELKTFERKNDIFIKD